MNIINFILKLAIWIFGWVMIFAGFCIIGAAEVIWSAPYVFGFFNIVWGTITEWWLIFKNDKE